MSKLTLFDIPSKSRTCWSPNPWKTRLALNFKNVDYQTEWVEYPDIKPTISPHVPAGGPGPTGMTMPYTLPTVRFPDSSYLMDSAAIANRIEALYPSPSLSLSSPAISQTEEVIRQVMGALAGWTMPLAVNKILNLRSAEYFARTRKESFGISIEQLGADKGGEAAWEDAAGPLKELGDLLRKEDGPFVLGTTVSYADFHIVGLLQFFKLLDEKAIFGRALEIEPALKTLYEASGKWLERDDH